MARVEYVNQFIDEALENFDKWEESCLNLNSGYSLEVYNLLYRIAHNLKGGSQIIEHQGLSNFFHNVEDFLRMLREEELETTQESTSCLLEVETFAREWVNRLSSDPDHNPDSSDIFDHITQIKNASGETKSISEAESQSPSLDQQLQELEVTEEDYTPDRRRGPSAGGKVSSEVHRETSVRVAATKLDSLIQIIGELSLYQSIVQQGMSSGNLHSEVSRNAINASSKLSKQLQSTVLDLRMQPLHGLFQKLKRTAIELANKQGKKIEVDISGDSVAMDKTVIEKVAEPLIHCIRNSIDHGIEPLEERKENFKKEVAKLSISAINEAGGVSIIITDDGKGIDPDHVYKKAIEKGLITPEKELEDQEKTNLIFLPGFSTREEVSDISGRGMGMDILKYAVQNLNGELDLESVVGLGTQIKMNLPINLSIMEALVVRIEGLDYAIPTKDLSEVIDLSDYKVETSGKDQKMINLRGKVVPLNSLRRFLPVGQIQAQKPIQNMDFVEEKPEDDVLKQFKKKNYPALIFESESGKLAFWVDQIKQQQQIFVRPLEDQLASIPGIGGATILSNGEPSMIVNLPTIARRVFMRVQ